MISYSSFTSLNTARIHNSFETSHTKLRPLPLSGKSELGRRLASMGGGGLFFERLLTKYSNPEELFGPLSLSALERDEYIRNTDVSAAP
jgi:hypothetical protein